MKAIKNLLPKKDFNTLVHKEWAFVFVLFLAILGIYYPSLFNKFANIDDPFYITYNTFIRDLSWTGVWKIFSEPIVANYFPLQILSYSLDYLLWHIQPFGYHLTNLILHILNAVLLFLLLKSIFSDPWISFLAALFWGLHPVNVESVSWVAERKNVLSMAFLLLSFLTYLAYLKQTTRRRRRDFYLGTLLLFLLSLLAKVSAVVLPLLFLLYDFCFRREGKMEMIKEKIPFFLLSILFAMITVWVYHRGDQLVDFYGGSPYFHALAMVNVLVEYLISLVMPLYLDNYYITPIPKSIFEAQVLLSIAALILIALLVWRSLRRHRLLFFWAGWFFISLLPMINIVPIAILRADRYMYLPAVGFFYFLAKVLLRLWGMKPRHVLLTLSLLLIFFLTAGYSFLTLERNKVWKDTITLWSDNIKKFPSHSSAYLYIGGTYWALGKLDAAILLCKSGLRENPRDVNLLNCLSMVYKSKGNLESAESLLREAASLDPAYSSTYNNLGAIYYQKGEMDKALGEFERAAKLSPNDSPALANIGVIFWERGQIDEALQQFKKALAISPASIQAHINLALSYEKKGMVSKAIESLKKGLDYVPESHGAHFHLGRIYFEKGNWQAAHYYFRRAWRINPNDGDTNIYLGLMARETANSYFEKALKTNVPAPQAKMIESLIGRDPWHKHQ